MTTETLPLFLFPVGIQLRAEGSQVWGSARAFLTPVYNFPEWSVAHHAQGVALLCPRGTKALLPQFLPSSPHLLD